jgi:uncharacterized protein
VVYYAGHGLELNGVNYLVPVDATLERDVDVEDEAIPLDGVLRTIEAANACDSSSSMPAGTIL